MVQAGYTLACCHAVVVWVEKSWLPLSSQGVGQSLSFFIGSGELMTSVSGAFHSQSLPRHQLHSRGKDLKPRDTAVPEITRPSRL